jgi:hypothetical protein
MEQALALMQLCKVGVTVSAVICVLAAALAVYLYFKNDIRMQWALQKGNADKVTEKRATKKTEHTGQLKRKVDLDFETDNLGKKPSAKSGRTGKSGRTAKPKAEIPDTQAMSPGAAFGIRFEIIEEILVTHTSETIQL